jgi:hypothetical protein
VEAKKPDSQMADDPAPEAESAFLRSFGRRDLTHAPQTIEDTERNLS